MGHQCDVADEMDELELGILDDLPLSSSRGTAGDAQYAIDEDELIDEYTFIDSDRVVI